MTLHDQLDALVADVEARHDAHAVWHEAQTRRTRQVASTAAALVAAAIVVLLVLVPLLPTASRAAQPARAPSPAATAFPQRLGHQLFVPSMPDAPGPMAAVAHAYPLFDVPDETRTNDIWSPSGARYHVPGHAPSSVRSALSADGRLLAYSPGPNDHVHLRDLVTGEDVTTELESETLPGSDTTMARALTWSPDGSRLVAVLQDSLDHAGGEVVVVDRGGRAHRMPFPTAAPRTRLQLAGWFDARTLAFAQHGTGSTPTLLHLSAEDGHLTGTTVLPGATVGDDALWSLSPDARRVTATDIHDLGRESRRDTLHLWDLGGPRLLMSTADPVGSVAGWLGGDPLCLGHDTITRYRPGHAPEVVAVTDVEPWDLSLAGSVQGVTPAFGGTSTSRLSWWWSDLLLVGSGLTLAVLAVLVLLRRRERR